MRGQIAAPTVASMPVSAKKRRTGDKSDPKNSPPGKSKSNFSRLFGIFQEVALPVSMKK
jgi:hypothetical protein